MGGRNLRPFRFNPRGVVDALDGGQVPEGGLRAATDLIFDSANPFTFECRPASVKRYNYSDFTNAEAVSVAYQIGDICYGLVASDDVMGYDSPFAFNLATNMPVTVTGTQTSSTLPLTPNTSGDWTPPTMALVGVLLYVTHPGFVGGGSAFFGWFDITTPSAPVWHGGNTGTNALPSVPLAVAQYNNRAWFAVKNAAYFTDALANNITAGTQIITFGDSGFLTALASLPVTTQVQGIIQALAVFKAASVTLVTGDAFDGTLSENVISPAGVGCDAGRTIATTPKGIKFMATDGIRLIDQSGVLGDPNPDLKIPFTYALSPSRASASYNNSIYRITVQNGHANGNPKQEYWFDDRYNGWTGPHSFTQDLAVAYSNSFVIFSNETAPALWVSDVIQTGTSLFVENDNDMSFLLITSPLADTGGLYENSAVLSVIDMELPTNGDAYTFTASDVSHGALATATITSPITGYLWASSVYTWNGGLWTANSYGLDRYNIPWDTPLVFSRMIWQITGPSSYGFKVGKLTVGYQPLNYVRL